MKIDISKSEVIASYPLQYIQNVNYGPKEQIHSKNYISCSNGLFIGSIKLRDSTCTLQYSDGKVIPDTQGFCCNCPVGSYIFGLKSGSPHRGQCSFFKTMTSGHCLRFPNNWFSVYKVNLFIIKDW